MTTEGHITMADGVRLYFRRIGTGGAMVLVPNGMYFIEEFAPLAHDRSLVFYDVRGRGRSDAITDPEQLTRGIDQDVDDLDGVRRHFGMSDVAVLGHSYAGNIVMLYAMTYAQHVSCVVQMGAMAPSLATTYPVELTNADDTLRLTLAALQALEPERSTLDPEVFCRKFWSILSVLYVADPADAARIAWGRCDLPNERGAMKNWMRYTLPSIQRLLLTDRDLSRVQAPTLVVHGTKDRSSPYGAGRDWALHLPNARLVTVENAAHAVWIEAPHIIDDIDRFLRGEWPSNAERVTSLLRPASA